MSLSNRGGALTLNGARSMHAAFAQLSPLACNAHSGSTEICLGEYGQARAQPEHLNMNAGLAYSLKIVSHKS